MHGNMLDADPNKLLRRRAADEERVGLEVEEDGDDVEIWEAGVGVEADDVLCEGGFLRRGEGSGLGADLPQGHLVGG